MDKTKSTLKTLHIIKTSKYELIRCLSETTEFNVQECKLLLLVHKKIVNSGGPLTLARFVKVCNVLNQKPMKLSQIKLFFDSFDTDGNGIMSGSEWVRFLSTFFREDPAKIDSVLTGVYNQEVPDPDIKEDLVTSIKKALDWRELDAPLSKQTPKKKISKVKITKTEKTKPTLTAKTLKTRANKKKVPSKTNLSAKKSISAIEISNGSGDAPVLAVSIPFKIEQNDHIMNLLKRMPKGKLLAMTKTLAALKDEYRRNKGQGSFSEEIQRKLTHLQKAYGIIWDKDVINSCFEKSQTFKL